MKRALLALAAVIAWRLFGLGVVLACILIMAAII